MTLEIIQREKEKQIALQAKIEKKTTKIYQENFTQANYKLRAAIAKTKIERSNAKVANLSLQMAQVGEDIAVIKLGAQRDTRQFEHASRLLQQKGYAAQLTLKQVDLNDKILSVTSKANISGSQAIGLISTSDLSVPSIEIPALTGG